jgi:outer membrane protein insertion porin family
VKSSISGSLVYNTIDDLKDPRDGIYATLVTEFAGLGGDAKFVRVTGRASYYRVLVDSLDVVGVVTAGGGHVEAISGGISTFDLFQASNRIVRGFEHGGFGPVSTATGEHLGGTSYFHGSVEAQFPLPLLPESFGVRAAVFADAGTLFNYPLALGVGDTLASGGSSIRASVGAGLIWNSPFGPLRIDYAVPVMSLPTDDVQEFNFGISSRF